MNFALSLVETLDPADPPVERTHPELPDDRHRDGGSGVLASRYLESVLTLR